MRKRTSGDTKMGHFLIPATCVKLWNWCWMSAAEVPRVEGKP